MTGQRAGGARTTIFLSVAAMAAAVMAGALGAGGCAVGLAAAADTSSSDYVPTDVTAQTLRGARVLIAPPLDDDFDVPPPSVFVAGALAEIAAAAGGQPYPQSLRLAYYRAFVAKLRAVAASQGGPEIVELPGDRWAEYQRSHLKYVPPLPIRGLYLGSAFRVPPTRRLRALGVDADFVVVLADVGVGYWTTLNFGTAPPEARGNLATFGRFLLWDARRDKAIASGTLSGSAGYGALRGSYWTELAETSAESLFDRQPFAAR